MKKNKITPQSYKINVTPVPRYIPTDLARRIASMDVLFDGSKLLGFVAGYNWIKRIVSSTLHPDF